MRVYINGESKEVQGTPTSAVMKTSARQSSTSYLQTLNVTATNKVDNLNSIVFVHHSIAPITTTHNFAIEFDRNARGRQVKLGD